MQAVFEARLGRSAAGAARGVYGKALARTWFVHLPCGRSRFTAQSDSLSPPNSTRFEIGRSLRLLPLSHRPRASTDRAVPINKHSHGNKKGPPDGGPSEIEP